MKRPKSGLSLVSSSIICLQLLAQWHLSSSQPRLHLLLENSSRFAELIIATCVLTCVSKQTNTTDITVLKEERKIRTPLDDFPILEI